MFRNVPVMDIVFWEQGTGIPSKIFSQTKIFLVKKIPVPVPRTGTGNGILSSVS
jgi:hypothetical protein